MRWPKFETILGEVTKMSKEIEFGTQFYRWVKAFNEGQTVKDKLILFPGTVLRVISYGTSLVKVPLIPRLLFVASRPPFDVVVENRDGLFHCRKGKDDVMMAAEAYEYPLQKYFEEIKQGVFVDIGANIGKYTVKVARQMGNKGRVVAIEPDPETFRILKRNITLNKLQDTIAFNVACWNEDQELTLNISPSLETTGNFSVKRIPKCVSSAIKVRGLKIDDILRDLDICEVDFMKIDSEGVEVESLEGATETINKSKSLRILVEIYSHENLAKISAIFKNEMDIEHIYRNNFLLTKRRD